MKRLCCRTVEWRQADCFLHLQHMLEVSAIFLHACTKTLAPLVNCIVNDALVDVTPHLMQTLFQFVSVMHPRLVYSLLDDAPDPVINRIKVRAVCWPKIRWNERRRCLFEKSHSVTCPLPSVQWRCPVERRRIPLIPRASWVAAALTGARRGSMRR